MITNFFYLYYRFFKSNWKFTLEHVTIVKILGFLVLFVQNSRFFKLFQSFSSFRFFSLNCQTLGFQVFRQCCKTYYYQGQQYSVE